MSATVNHSVSKTLQEVPKGDEIVISGVAGRFPDSDNYKQFQENLMNKVDLVSDDDRRWKLDHPEIPQRTGKVNNLDKFDSVFFGVHYKQAHTMDPMCRLLLEHAYEAIVDAGLNPKELRGSNTGVFIGACFSESEKTWFYEKLQVNGFGITGCSRAMLSNRISYWLGVHGPSYSIDTACSSSLYAIEHAFKAMRDGECESAIVGGCNLCLHPYVSLQFSRLGVLSPDGRCKAFDESANGYVRSEAISAIFLQKAKNAKRIYATIIHAKTNCDGFKEHGITYPSSHMQSKLLEDFYKEIGIPPNSVDFVEAHGTGTKVGDPEEIQAIQKIFCPGRNEPLLIGSVKTNIGHSEPASGLCSVAKVIIGMESGLLPPNLHFNNPRVDIKAITEGKIKVVTEPTPWKGGLVGINSFGFGGANAHVLLKFNPKEKVNNGLPKDNLPRVVAVSGRTREAVDVLLDDIESRPVDIEYVRLLHDIHADEIKGHLYRGYTVLPASGLVRNKIREVENFLGEKKPVWFVFSGMGSQWPGMGESLMRLPIFADAIKKCDAILKPQGLDIIKIITSKDKKIFDNILHSFVGIAAVQIGLVDVLRSVGIEPDKIIGHSVGELGCAYADGCFTATEMILSAYSRGLASIETELPRGSMAAVGLGYKELEKMCPPDIEVACHNASDSATISGPAESMKVFVQKLQESNIFAKEVPCSNIPYHSSYIAPAGPKLLAYLKKVIPNPKPRSPKWASTSIPRNKWDTAVAKLSSAEYHTNNLLSPVLFEEATLLIPNNAIAIEIAPHGLLQAILKRSLSRTVVNIPLTKRGHPDNVEILSQGLGKAFITGLHPQLYKLYPHVPFPVSRSTPMISPLIKWEHSDNWYVTAYRLQEKIKSGERHVLINIADEDSEYVSGHVVDGRNLYPATGYLHMVWETMGLMLGELYTEVSVIFENVKFLRATTIRQEGTIDFTVMVQKGSGRFEIIENGAAVVTGYVHVMPESQREMLNTNNTFNDGEKESMMTRDIYKELRLRGYQYSGLFRSLKSATINGSKGHIIWHNNWVAFMDNMLQIILLGSDTRGLFIPTGIRKLVIDTKKHVSILRSLNADEEVALPVYVHEELNYVVSGGVEMHGMTASAIARRKPISEPVLEEYKFVAYADRANVTYRDMVRFSVHIALENHLQNRVKTLELVEKQDKVPIQDLLSPLVSEALGNLPLIHADVNIVGNNLEFEDDVLPSNITVFEPKKVNSETAAALSIGHRLLTADRAVNLQLLVAGLINGGFILTREDASQKLDVEQIAQSKNLMVIMVKRSNQEVFVLLRKIEQVPRKKLVIEITNNNFEWVNEMRQVMKNEIEKGSKSLRIIFVGEGDFYNGLIGFVNCLRKELGGDLVRGILIQDPKAPKFSLEHPMYAKEILKDLSVSVLQANGVWGSYRHLPIQALEPKPVRHAWANQMIRADLSSLTWLEGPIQIGYENENLTNVAYASINFRDIMLATGKLPMEVVAKTRLTQECVLGFEFCGVTTKGKRIMGLIDCRAMTNLCVADPCLCWEVPSSWSLEDAATVPSVYGTCYYALYISGKMKKGDKVLIHAGSGGVGQAAIHLALFEGCEVFTTVGTPEKRRFILENFPQIPSDHIGNSRNTSFEQMILQCTQGRGVDIVLNSLAEEKLQASVRCLAQGGRFLEIGKFDLAADNPLGMGCFLREISFHGIMLDNLFNASSEMKMELREKLSVGLTNEAIKPLTRTVFPKDRLEAAFRYMAAGKHIGKVLIEIRDKNQSVVDLIMALPRFHCFEGHSYIILGGLGGFGLELADWLVLRGARNIVLTSRTGIRNGYQEKRLSIWKSYGANIDIVVNKNVSKYEDCQAIIEAAAKLGPVDAIFNLAVVLKDALWENQTPETFEDSFCPKARATKHFDIITRKMCPSLRHFVVFSSVSCGRGNAGQTNYGMSNSVMERICEKRVADGFPGLAVQWGAIGDVGIVADMQEEDKEVVIGGTLQQKITSCLQELNGFLCRNATIVSSIVVAEKNLAGYGNLNMVNTVLNIMGLKDLNSVSPQTSLAELGMDSMMAVEIKQTLEREFEIYLTAQDIRGLNFAKLQDMQSAASKQDDLSETPAGMKLFVRFIGEKLVDNMYHKLVTGNDPNLSEVYLIPGIEGFSKVFNNIASHIKAPASVLQPLTKDFEIQRSIPAIAEKLIPYILERNGDRSFVILGYSFGSLVAIELVRKLEAQGLSGKLILVDGSPIMLKAISAHRLKFSTDDELQNNILMGLMEIRAPFLTIELANQIEKLQTWEQKIKVFFECLSKSTSLVYDVDIESESSFCTAFYNRVHATMNYDPSNLPQLRTPIVLIKPSSVTYTGDFGLPSVTTGKIEEYIVEGNHMTIIDNVKIATAINGDPLDDGEEFRTMLITDNSKEVMSLIE